MCRSDDRSLDQVDDNDDDCYDVPPAFRRSQDSSCSKPRLSSVGETERATERDRCTTPCRQDADDDYDVLPGSARPVPTSPTVDDDTYDYLTTTTDDRRQSATVATTVVRFDQELYDFIRLRDRSDGAHWDDVVRRTSTIDPDTYDYLTTTDDLRQSATVAATLVRSDEQLYDFIRPRDGSDGGRSDDVVRRTSTIDPDTYDYTRTHAERTDRLFDSGDKVGVTAEGTACADELYDYPPPRSSREAAAAICRVPDGGTSSPSAAAAFVDSKHSSSASSSSTSLEHYDVLPSRPESSAADLLLAVRDATVSQSAADMARATDDGDVYDCIAPPAKHSMIAVCYAVGSDEADAVWNDSAGKYLPTFKLLWIFFTSSSYLARSVIEPSR